MAITEEAANISARPAPRVSIVIPAYQTASYIGETLDSVRAQTFTDYELIVVNDGSPDTEELERVLQPYRAELRYVRQENSGASSARNTGIRLARGTYVALVDSDDLWEPDYLAVQVATLESDPTAVLSYTNMIMFGDAPDAGRECKSFLPAQGEVTIKRLVEQQCNATSNVVARRDALLQAGLFDEALSTGEDFELWLRLVHRGGRLVYHRRPLWRYRKRPGSLTTNPLVLWRNYLNVLEKVRCNMNLAPDDSAAVARRAEYCHAMLRLYEGKRSFFAGDFAAAAHSLAIANTYLHSSKLALAIRLMRLAPQVLLRVYIARDRFVHGTTTRF